MNSLGTHDTPRILTLLGTGGDGKDHDKDWRAAFRMSSGQYALGKARLKLGALVIFAFPGSPMVYYGDEAGMEGFEDPFNRRTYPRGREDGELLGRPAGRCPPCAGGSWPGRSPGDGYSLSSALGPRGAYWPPSTPANGRSPLICPGPPGTG